MQNAHDVAADRSPTGGPQVTQTPPQGVAEKAQKKVADAADQAGSAARDAASATLEQVQDKTDEAVSTVASKATDVAEQGKDWTRHTMRSIGRAIQAGGESLERDGMTATAGYVRSAANGLLQAADGVEEVNTSHLTGRAEQFVRERPMVSVAALALVGFAVASVLRK